MERRRREEVVRVGWIWEAWRGLPISHALVDEFEVALPEVADDLAIH